LFIHVCFHYEEHGYKTVRTVKRRSMNLFRSLVGKYNRGLQPFGRPRMIREDKVKVDFKETGYEERRWMELA